MSQPKKHRPKSKAKSKRGYWLRTMIQWHWISSAICLVGMVMFAITGITLNHASEIETSPVITKKTVQLPEQQLAELSLQTDLENAPLPDSVANWLSQELAHPIGKRLAEWSDDEIYLSMPTAGADSWLVIDRVSGDTEFENTNRGWIAYFNDLHKGRNTGPLWKWFIDIFSIGTLIFCLTGLYLLYFHAKHRKMTWPVVGLGLLIPFVLATIMSHFP
ncbi:PepSY-associated TM helix domain-containing protein [Planctomicrobium sp. SH668]|uniref:PepSY-associated TM helix domain-containing protein n=1 Tax=Planctomicrobium sp. SH668 TaxID=3448126 RepID=UPI003F5B36AA